MDFFVILGPQRDALPISQIIEALKRLEENPERLSRERTQRVEVTPPPYSSGETKQPGIFGASETEVDRRVRRRQDRLQSVPREQFQHQWAREMDRLIRQQNMNWRGRRQTLPYDSKVDYEINAKNNVRNRWIEQGIWRSEWGENLPLAWSGWKHEISPFNFLNAPRPITDEQRAAHERETAASRPFYQFLYQLSRETEWIRDELYFNRSSESVDLGTKAYESVKNAWIQDKIWNPKWGCLPGMTWMHEEPNEDATPTKGPLSEAAGNDDRQHGTKVSDYVKNKYAFITGVEPTTQRTRNRSFRVPTILEDPPTAEESVNRVLGKVRSSRVEKHHKSNASVANDLFPRQRGPPIKTTEALSPTRRDGTLFGSETAKGGFSAGIRCKNLRRGVSNATSPSLRRRASIAASKVGAGGATNDTVDICPKPEQPTAAVNKTEQASKPPIFGKNTQVTGSDQDQESIQEDGRSTWPWGS